MPSKSANVKNEKQYEALKDKGMSKERAARIANSPGASTPGWQEERLRWRQLPGRNHRSEEEGRPQGRQGGREEGLTGAPGGIRNPNLLIRSQMLYPLSYGRSVQATWKPRLGLVEDSRPPRAGRIRAPAR